MISKTVLWVVIALQSGLIGVLVHHALLKKRYSGDDKK